MMTQRKNSNQINFIAPTYNNNNTTKRSISYNSLNTNDENAAADAASASNSSSALITNNININYNPVSPRILVDANGNQQSVIYPTVNKLPPRTPVPPIFLPPENKCNNNISNHHHHHNDQSTFDKFKLKVQKIFNRPNSKSPTSSKYNIDESADNGTFKSYVILNRPRNDNGHASNSLGKTNGAAFFKHSTSLQDQLKNEQYASNYDLNNTTTATTTTATTNINRNVIFVNNLPNKRGEKFFYDIETKAEIKRKLDLLPVEGI